MNKRIKELAERAGWPADINEQDMYEIVGPKFAEELAKLIVKECMDIADVESKNRTGHGRVAADAIWFTIKNRFGVE